MDIVSQDDVEIFRKIVRATIFYEGRCGAQRCRKPRKKNLKWTECAGCNVWFHDFCLDNKDQNLNLTFCCSNCNF